MPNVFRQFPLFRRLLPYALIAIALQSQAGAQQGGEAPIDLANPAPQWQTLFAELGSHPRIESEFTERRHFPFRKFPKRLRGIMHFDERKGIALHYQSPGDYTVFALPSGVHIRNADDDDSSEIPSHASSATMLRILPDLMRFAPQKLAARFTANGLLSANGHWQITLERRSPELVPGLQEIRLRGDGGQLRGLILVRGVQERSEIDIGHTRFPAADAADNVQWPHTSAKDSPADSAAEPTTKPTTTPHRDN